MSETKVALITGSTRGIGRAIAQRLLADGFAVVVHGRSGADTLATELAGAGHRAVGLNVDLLAEGGPRRLAAEALAAFGRLDVLVNNAGLLEAAALRRTPTGHWDRVMGLNARVPLVLSQACLKPLRATAGCIVNIASLAARRPPLTLGVYAASKAALVALSQGLAQEWAPYRIRVNTVLPGLVATDMTAGITTEAAVRGIPLGRAATPDEVAALVAFLASPAASYCTGGEYPVGGGA